MNSKAQKSIYNYPNRGRFFLVEICNHLNEMTWSLHLPMSFLGQNFTLFVFIIGDPFSGGPARVSLRFRVPLPENKHVSRHAPKVSEAQFEVLSPLLMPSKYFGQTFFSIRAKNPPTIQHQRPWPGIEPGPRDPQSPMRAVTLPRPCQHYLYADAA